MFFLGLFAGIAACATIGFVIILSMVLSGKGAMLTGGSQQVAQQGAPTPAQQQAAQPGTQQPTTPSAPVDVSMGHFPLLGDAKAKVTVVEFADFRCPFCERFYTSDEKNIIKDYVNSGKVKYAFRSFAFLGPESTAASEAAECANDQGLFWKFHDWMYEHQADESNTAYYSNDNLIKYAVALGANSAKFTSCLNSHADAAKAQQDLTDGQSAGVNGTPTLFVNGTSLVGAVPYAQVKAAIDAALAK